MAGRRRYPLRETKARKAFYSSKNDRLSDLPDDLLRQIFSEFGIKEVIRTCILSKKWRYFWTTLSVLKLDAFSLPGSSKSIKFDDLVTQVLDRGCKNTKINILSIVALERCSEINIRSWIQIAVNRDVQELNLLFGEPDSMAISIPPSLFTCQSLTKLELDLNISLRCEPVRLTLPNSIDLPRLKELNLDAVSSLSTQFLDELFSGCPVLEMLLIENCTFDESRSLVITSNRLKRLVIENCGDMYGDRECEITVHAPKVIWFKCTDWNSNNYHLDNVASLETMHLENGMSCSTTVQEAHRTIKWLRKISSVRSLTLQENVFKVVSQYLDILHKAPISFGHLSYLNIRIWIVKEFVQAVKCILENSPNIETLIIKLIWPEEISAEVSDGWGEGLSLQNLKCVELHSVKGFDYELGLLKGLLKNAMALEEMTIFTVASLSRKDRRRVKSFTKNLMNFPRVSTRVKISLCETREG